MSTETQTRDLAPDALVSVVAPFYNEAAGVDAFVAEVTDALDALALPCRHELLLVNDGSTDGTGERLDALAGAHACRLRVVHLARNFGHAGAVSAGLDHARGEVVIVMDGDHQDDPAAFDAFLARWRAGHDAVYAERMHRPEGGLRRALFWLFHHLFARLATPRMPHNAGNFALMDRRVVDHMRAMAERNRYLPGMRAWVGFPQTGVPVARRPRHDTRTRVGLGGLWRLAMDAIFSFSHAPLFLFRVAGVVSILFCAGVIAWALYDRLISERAVPAWASEVITFTFLGGLNLLGIGLVGEYIARIHEEVQARPLYIIARVNRPE